ncbi:hypothetical protein HAZT_HAZT008254 [Hyalella azteca]|uniref:Uncharacterized protein n=1 Tax=Hyalella azteca TaxID=294128 RepID=A0A6A0H0D6_HYAAZ|nr:hypothetical protein HAZT_HAZT008254 [Hyalella azteca]
MTLLQEKKNLLQNSCMSREQDSSAEEQQNSVLEPLLHLVVAFATDIPQHFYEHHFYEFLPHIVSYCDSQEPAQIEQVFSCLLNLLVTLKSDLIREPFKLYSQCFADLLSSSRPWYINDIAVQTFAFIVRKVVDKELFFYQVFKRLAKDPSQAKGLGKLLTAVMKSNSLNRVHSVTAEVVRIMLNLLALSRVPQALTLEAFLVGLKGLLCFIALKNSLKNWQEFWAEDNERVWTPIWRHLDALVQELPPMEALASCKGDAEDETDLPSKVLDARQEEETNSDDGGEMSDMKELRIRLGIKSSSASRTSTCTVSVDCQLTSVLSVVKFLVEFKRGSLLPDVCLVFNKIESLLARHSSPEVGHLIADILVCLLKSPKHQACPGNYEAAVPLQVRRNRIISLMFQSNFPAPVLFSFARGCSSLEHFQHEVLPKLLRYLDSIVFSSQDDETRLSVLSLVMDLLLHHQPPVTCGEQLSQWQKYPLLFSKRCPANTDKMSPSSVPELLESLACGGLMDDLSNIEALLTSVLCVPHVEPLDCQEMASYLAGILSDALNSLQVSPKTVMATEELTPLDRPVTKKRSLENGVENPNSGSSLPVFDFNIDVSLDRSTHMLLFLVDVTVEALAHTLSTRDFLATLTGMNVINILRGHPQHRENEHLLRAIDIYLTIAAQAPDNLDDFVTNPISEETFCAVYKILAPSLASPSAQTRMLVAHILSLFPLQLPPPPNGTAKLENLFQIMYKIESMQVTALNYNERLRLLALLDHERVDARSPVSGICELAPVLFGIGQMYVNLRPVWGYAVVYVSAFAKKLSQDNFWPLWISKLKLVSHAALSSAMHSTEGSLSSTCKTASLVRVHEYLTSHAGSGKLSSRIDHANVRNLMWKTMHRFPNICELRNRDIVSTFFQFMEEEMEMTDFSMAPTENLEKTGLSATAKTEDCSEEHDEDEADDGEINDSDDDENPDDDDRLDDNNQSKNSELDESTVLDETQKDPENSDVRTKKNRRSKLVINSLCNYLNLFAKFYNLKSVHMADSLEKIFMDLLVHPSMRVQELSLSCVLALKKRSILPYKDSLCLIQSNKAFKRGVMALRVDSSGDDTNSVAEEHRSELMPLYIRLLYSKMLTSVGRNTTGKNKILVRKTTVMRLLAGIRDEESKYLLHLAFEILEPHLQGSCSEVVDAAFRGLDASKSIPLKRMYGVLSSLDSMIHYLGNLLPTKQSYFLKVILLLLSHATVLKDHTPSVHHSHKNLLKKIKNRAMNELLKFYDSFQNYNWSQDELEAVFKCVVWPSLIQLPTEGVINVHPVLKLFSKWSENEYLHPLFIKHHPDDVTLSPLPYIFSLATEPKCRVGVINFILNIVHNLIGQNESMVETSDERPRKFKKGKFGKEEVKASPKPSDSTFVDMIRCDNLLTVAEPTKLVDVSETPTLGTKILLPYIRALCSCMQTVLHQLLRKSGRDTKLLRILCLVTQFVCDDEEGDKLLSLIIPMLVKKKTDDTEVINHLLLTSSNLLPISKNVENFSLKMLPLFRSLVNQSSRVQLCNVYEKLGKKQNQFKDLSDVMSGLNSWEESFMDSIDVGRRTKSYKRLVCLLQSTQQFDVTLFQFAVHQTSYDLHRMTDITLQESAVVAATEVMRSSLRFCDSNRAQVNSLLNSILVSIKRGVTASSDVVHCLHLRLLGEAVHLAGDHLKPLKDLKNINPDIDFFKNVSHLQMARRALVQNKLISGMVSGKFPLKVETIEMFLWPLLCRYITNHHYAQETALMNATYTNLLEVVLRLSWKTYLSGLKFFLHRLKDDSEGNRLTLKVVGIILDGFHEDVSGLVLRKTKLPRGSKKGKKVPQKSRNRQSKSRGASKMKSKKANLKASINETGTEIPIKSNEDEESLVSTEIKPPVAPEDSIKTNAPVDAAKNAHCLIVYNALVREIIPGLKRVFESRSEADGFHKMNKTKRASDDDIKKIPLALPLVKVLKKFPESVLEANLSNVFYQLMCYLRSHVPYIRREARETILKVLKEMGFQRHVLIHLIKSIFVSCADILKSNYVCRCLTEIVELCCEELFANKGVEDRADDREKDSEPVEEAKGDKKSYVIMAALGRFVQVQRVEDVLGPLKEVLTSTHRKSVVTMVEKCVTNFMLGLESNESVTLVEKLILAYGILTEKVVEFKKEGNAEEAIKTVAKTSTSTNSYVLVNFAFGLLFKLLQKNALSRDDPEHNGLLDPFVGLLMNFLHSSHPEKKLDLLSLNCSCYSINTTLRNSRKASCSTWFNSPSDALPSFLSTLTTIL